MAEIKITAANFDEVVTASELPVLVDFWASWCGPCKMLAPTVAELAEELEGKVVVGKINTEDDPELAERFRVMSIPTLILFKNGEPAARTTGFQSKEAICQKLFEA